MDQDLKLYDHFDYSVLSCKEHLKKPDPEFYKIALAKADVRPEEAVFIDDKEKCITAARELGMKGILYSGNAKLVEELEKVGVFVKQEVI